jgi:hypothetical protein
MEFRIGINLDDVMVEDEQIYGAASTLRRAWRVLPSQAASIFLVPSASTSATDRA